MSAWLLLYLFFLPVAIWWYGVRLRRLSRRFRSWVSRLASRFLDSLAIRLRDRPTAPTADAPEEETRRATPLHPRP